MDRIRATSLFLWGLAAGVWLLYVVIHGRIDHAPKLISVAPAHSVSESTSSVEPPPPAAHPMALYDENPEATQRILNGDYPRPVTTLPGPEKTAKTPQDCLALTGGQINDAYVQCRYGK